MTWSVHKFGGTSVASPERIRSVAAIVRQEKKPFVVVSAMGGVTNALLALIDQAKTRDASYVRGIRELREKHIEALAELTTGESVEELTERVRSDCDDIEDLLRAVWLSKTAEPTIVDLISGYGELWSAAILAAHLVSEGVDAFFLDARDVVVAHDGAVSPVIHWDESRTNLNAIDALSHACVVATGFVCSSPEGVPRTLGRNGSDFSASIFGALTSADRITIWTDVDGVLSANPKQVPEAKVLPTLSYHEAMELSYFGAKVVHPNTMAPAVEHNIPITIRNTFNPDAPGTTISALSDTSSGSLVKGFASVDHMALINVEGSNMMGVPGIAQRLFGGLRDSGVSVVMISQGSSEHSICFAVPETDAETAKGAVEEVFYAERDQGYIQAIDVTPNCAIVAAVGDSMEGIPGVAAKFFGALGKARVNIRAIAQGSSERNISAVIDAADDTKALRAVHAGFYLSNQTLSIGVIGAGVVGQTLLDQFQEQHETLENDFQIDLRVRGIATSKKMATDDIAIELSSWRAALDTGSDLNLEKFVEHVQTDSIPHTVLIDCTSDPVVASKYAEWMARGIHIVTPNKKANSGDFESYRELQELTRRHHVNYLYETTVGAGLPILQTAQDLVQTGDALISVSGVFSGTLSYLFNSYDGTTSFSELVKEAKAKGFTEPDPRDDLRGTDVARKLVILAREFGHTLELSDVEVSSLVPDELDEVSVEDFVDRYSDVDDEMLKRFQTATAEGQVLRYVGSFSAEGTAKVELVTLPETHPFGRIRLTDNIVQFETTRYSNNPLVVQGPGAGPDVTAGGIFADVLRLASYVGATR